MIREELYEKICYSDFTNDCCSCDGNYNCDDCQAMIDPLLDEYEQTIRADERAKIKELVMQLGNKWEPSDLIEGYHEALNDVLALLS